MDIVLQRILSLLPHKEDGRIIRGAKKDFAKSIGYDSGDIVSMWIKGTSTSYKNKIHEIADKYNVSVEWLLGESEVKEKNAAGSGDSLSDQESYFIHCLRLMTEDERKCFIAQAKGVTEDRGAFDDNKEE